MSEASGQDQQGIVSIPTDGIIHPYDESEDVTAHSNIISNEYLAYIDEMDSSFYNSISYTRSVALNLVIQTESGGYQTTGSSTSLGFSSDVLFQRIF